MPRKPLASVYMIKQNFLSSFRLRYVQIRNKQDNTWTLIDYIETAIYRNCNTLYRNYNITFPALKKIWKLLKFWEMWTDQAFIVLPNIHLSYYDPTENVSFPQLLYNVYVNPKQQVARVKFCLSSKVLFTPVSLNIHVFYFIPGNK